MSRYDRRDPDPTTLKLTRAGHHLWFQYKKSQDGRHPEQERAFSDALEIIYQAKKDVKASIAARIKEETVAIRRRVGVTAKIRLSPQTRGIYLAESTNKNGVSEP